MRTLLLGTCAFVFSLSLAGWGRSRWVGDDISYAAATNHQGAPAVQSIGFAHGDGDVALIAIRFSRGSPRALGRHYARLAIGPIRQMMPDRVVGLFGYGVVDSHTVLPGVRYAALVLPYWLITLASALPFLLIGWRDRAARRIAGGRCAACNYDLRATPGRCPECGAVAPMPLPSPGVA